MKLSEFFVFFLLTCRRESERIEFFLLSAEFEAVRFGALIDKPFGVSHSPFGLNAKKHGDGRVTYLFRHVCAVVLRFGVFDIHIEIEFERLARDGYLDEMKSAEIDAVELSRKTGFEFAETKSVVFKFVVSLLHDFVARENFLRERRRNIGVLVHLDGSDGSCNRRYGGNLDFLRGYARRGFVRKSS